MDKNTEQWVNDQNKFWEKKRENLEETIPKVFEPQGPVKILQKGKQPQSEVTKQTPIKTRVNRDFWNSSYDGPNYRNGYQKGYPGENRNWEQRNGYGRRYGNEKLTSAEKGPWKDYYPDPNTSHHPKGKSPLSKHIIQKNEW